jgi:type I restriction enzyme S subunit
MKNKRDEVHENPPKIKTRVPRLRFPEFINAPQWEIKKLGELCEICTGKKDANESNVNGLYPFFTCAENHIFSDTYSFDTEAILVAGNANVGQAKYYRGKFEAYQRTYVLTHFNRCINVLYLYSILDSNLRPSLLTQVQTSAMSYIKLPMLQEYRLPIPPNLKEQQKIADCLSSIDDLIAAHTRKLDALKAHKKGLMQRLFPAEGETVPRLRFPEFRDAPEWKVKELSAACEINPSNTSLPDKFIYIDLESVSSGCLLDEKRMSLKEAPSRAQRLLENGDVIFQMVRPYQRNNLLCRFNDDNHYVASTGYAQLRPFDSSEFLFQIVHTDPFVEKVLSKCTGSSYPAINSTDLANIQVALPAFAEQQKIADSLSSLDSLIASQSQKIDALNQHKKALMQQLFPQAEEEE